MVVSEDGSEIRSEDDDGNESEARSETRSDDVETGDQGRHFVQD